MVTGDPWRIARLSLGGHFSFIVFFARLFWVLYTIRYTIGARIKGRFIFVKPKTFLCSFCCWFVVPSDISLIG